MRIKNRKDPSTGEAPTDTGDSVESLESRPRFWRLRAIWRLLIGAALISPAIRGPRFLRPTGSRLRKTIIYIATALLVFGLSAAAWGELWGTGRVDLALAFPLAALLTAPLVLIEWGPLWTWRAMTLGLALCSLFGAEQYVWPWPVTTIIIYLAIILMLATMHDRPTLIGIGVLTVLFVVLPSEGRYGSTVAFALSAVVGVALLIGDAIRGRREAEEDLANVISARHEDEARRAVLDERTRIARELHDVVAHHMSMIAIQAEAAPHKFRELSPEAVESFGLIRDTSKQALTEMRRVVGLLRESEEAAARTPQPTLERIDELVHATTRSGMSVDLDIQGMADAIPTAVDVSGYRIIQEGLGNASRHAPGEPVSVTIRYLPASVEIQVRNKLTRPPPSHDEKVRARRRFFPRRKKNRVAVSSSERQGHGIIGMRERVAIIEGKIDVGPLNDGTFAVIAQLPTTGLPLPGNESPQSPRQELSKDNSRNLSEPTVEDMVDEVVDQPSTTTQD